LLTEEEVQHLDDIILRRTLIGMLGELTPALLDELADIAAAALGWDDARRQSELERVRSGFAAFHGVTL
jgi:glycerol-3-phosphate dehydrogenase